MRYGEVDEKILTNNILIAEFWGYKFYPADKWWKIGGKVDHYWIENKDKSIQRLLPVKFRFDFDWDWLHPVIKKIMNMNFDEPFNGVLIDAKQKLYTDLRTPMLYDDLDSAYELVVEFINIYNKNKK